MIGETRRTVRRISYRHRRILRTYSFANVSETGNNCNFSSKHDIGSTLDTIDERLAAPVKVVELGLGDRVVDIDSRNLELAITKSLVQVVNTGGGLFRDSTDFYVTYFNMGEYMLKSATYPPDTEDTSRERW